MLCQEEKISSESTDSTQKSWKDIGGQFLRGVSGLIEGYAGNVVERQKEKLLQSAIAWSILLFSALFLLNAFALFLNDYFSLKSWAGYALTGLILIVARLVFPKIFQNRS